MLNTHRPSSALMITTMLFGTAVAAVAAEPSPPKVALDGNCAVCLVSAGKLVKGKDDFTATYDGFTYLFPSARERDVFSSNPEAYAPVLNGDCVVCVANANVRMAGSTKHVAKYDGRIYLFPAAEQKQIFEANPSEFANADTALDGNCAVCLAKAGKEVPGKVEFTARRDGWRYLFPSESERAVFLKSTEKFVVSTTGETDCAACTFGVHPLGTPSELGLAVKDGDSQVLVIEQAHKRYADVYGKRFEGLNVSVVGTPIKSEGRITWIRPTFLSVQQTN